MRRKNRASFLLSTVKLHFADRITTGKGFFQIQPQAILCRNPSVTLHCHVAEQGQPLLVQAKFPPPGKQRAVMEIDLNRILLTAHLRFEYSKIQIAIKRTGKFTTI